MSVTVIGLLAGIELLFSGLSRIMLSLEIRRIPEEAGRVEPIR